MDLTELQRQQSFHVHQKVIMTVNRYQVFTDEDGEPGELVAFVEQKWMKFKEEVTVFTDETRTSTLGGFKARKVFDTAGSFDVSGPDGRALGVITKKFRRSLLRSTWLVEQPGQPTVTVRERSGGLALFRRTWELIPWVGDLPFPWKYHFDFRRGDESVGSFEKKVRFRDHYVIRVEDPAMDRVLAITLSIALDALQSR